jgi:hypothetical protein
MMCLHIHTNSNRIVETVVNSGGVVQTMWVTWMISTRSVSIHNRSLAQGLTSDIEVTLGPPHMVRIH